MKNSGPYYVINGFSLILKPGIKRYLIIPTLINISLFIGLFLFAKYYFNEFNQWVIHLLPHWLQWLNVLLWVLFFIGFFLIFIYSFVTIANIIAAPFNSTLAEKIEFYLTGTTLPSQSIWGDIKDTPRVIGRQFAIIGYSLPRAMVLLLLFFIPIIQLAATFIWFLFNGWLMTLQYVDYPTDNHKIPIREVRYQLSQNKWLSLTFGLTVLIFSMIPILNFFIMPAAVAGATQMWIEQFNKSSKTLISQ